MVAWAKEEWTAPNDGWYTLFFDFINNMGISMGIFL